jgi:lysozyme
MPTPIVIDISHHNTIPSSLFPAKEAGIVGVIHKITEGSSYVDSKVDARWALANKAELLWGLYHFIRPGNAKAQAEFMFSKAMSMGICDPHTLWVLDHEDADVSTSDALAFLLRIEELTGREPVIYSGHVLKEAQNKQFNTAITLYKLWLCHYTTGQPKLPEGFPSWWLWQYTDQGAIPGVNPPTDLNAYGGLPDQLVEEWTGEAVLPPEPAPDEQVVTVIISAPPGVRVDVQVVEGD